MKIPTIFGLFFILVTTIIPIEFVFAQSAETCTATYPGSGWMVLDCSPGFTTSHDRISIFSRTSLDAGEPWQDNLNETNALWVFDAGAQGRASLIIDFHPDAGKLVADLYDDGNKDGSVDYQSAGARPFVRENNGHWSVRVIARDGWWRKGAILNLNLDLLVDGPNAMFLNAEAWGIKDKVITDGVVDYEVHVRDLDRDGKPDYEWRQSHFPLPEDPRINGHVRTEIIVNTEDDEIPFQEGVFWPWLSRKLNIDKKGKPVYNKGREGLPPIQVDWQNASIGQVAEFIIARSEPGSYSIYSKERVKEGELSTTDFENPIAFYNLANTQDHYQDLTIRVGVLMPSSPDVKFLNTTPLNDVEYAWDQYHTQHWDYQVGLAGRQTINEVTKFPEFTIASVPFAKLPEWVTSQKWDMATFVQVEKTPYYNSEFVWDWYTAQGTDSVRKQYLPGLSNTPPVGDFADIAIGFRGEYAFDYASNPVLYFSPIDRKLHLLKAQAGIFKLDDSRTMKYQNLGGDYIDHWDLLENGNFVKSLFFRAGYLIYTDLSSVQFAMPAVMPSLFTTLPPTNHDEWVKLGADLAKNKPTFAADDFQAMANQFGAAASAIQGASLRDLRVIPGGFRFILTLKPGFSLSGEDPLGVKGKAPGDYAVSYDGTIFHVQPLTPPDLRISFPASSSPEDLPVQYVRQDFQTVLRNTGLEDAQTVEVRAEFQGPGQKIIRAAPQKVSVPAGESLAVRIPWAPSAPGAWQVRVTAQVMHAQGQGGSLFSAVLPVQVAPAPQITVWSALSAFGLVPGWAVLLLLAAIAAVAGALGWSLLRGSPS